MANGGRAGLEGSDGLEGTGGTEGGGDAEGGGGVSNSGVRRFEVRRPTVGRAGKGLGLWYETSIFLG
jgi:hypothetical protein